MKLNAPKVVTWWIGVILGVLALLGALNVVPALGSFAIWMAIVGLALLAVASLVKGL
jgi:hypothetical protein